MSVVTGHLCSPQSESKLGDHGHSHDSMGTQNGLLVEFTSVALTELERAQKFDQTC